MPDNIQNEDATRPKRNRKTRPLSLRSLFALTAVFALWLCLLSEFRREPSAIMIIWSFAIFAGIAAHALYIYVLPWRGTVLTSLLVLPALLFLGYGWLLGSTANRWGHSAFELIESRGNTHRCVNGRFCHRNRQMCPGKCRSGVPMQLKGKT